MTGLDAVVPSRMASALEQVAQNEAEETEKAESQQVELGAELRVAEAELSRLNDGVVRAKKLVGELRDQLGGPRRSSDSMTSQRISDRVGLLGRVMGADHYDMDAMVSAFDDYWDREVTVRQMQQDDPTIERDRELLGEVEHGDYLSSLPDVVRAVVLEKAQEASERLKLLDIPTRPDVLAPVYVAEANTANGGYVYLVALPARSDASSHSSSHARLLVNVIAAMCSALRHRPEVQAPIVCGLPDREHGLVVCVTDVGVADDDKGYFAIRLEDQMKAAGWPYGLRYESIDDALLKRAMSSLTCDAELEEGF